MVLIPADCNPLGEGFAPGSGRKAINMGVLRLGLRRKLAVTIIIVAATLLLYAVGIKFLLVPALCVLNAYYLPLPKILDSWISRLFGSLLFVVILMQLAA